MNKEQKQRLANIISYYVFASPGPWSYENTNTIYGKDGKEDIWLADVRNEKDGAFIARARDDIPWLVDLVSELENCLHPVYDKDIDEYYREKEVVN
jgi:hypothetical protein